MDATPVNNARVTGEVQTSQCIYFALKLMG
ncbi:hypothetical protein ABIE33_007115 [Ensifer sp. 4252]